MGCLSEGQKAQEERGDTGRDNKLKKKEERSWEAEKRGKTKRKRGTKSWKEWNGSSYPVWMSPSWPSGSEELWWNTHQPLKPALHTTCLNRAGSDCWHRVCGGENQVAFTGASLGLAEAVKALLEPWTSVFPDPHRACGLSLPCQNWSSFVEYGALFLPWQSGMQVLCRV